MFKSKILLTSIIFFSFAALSTSAIKAENGFDLGYEKTNPSSPFIYKVKRLKEKIEGTFIDIFKKEQKGEYLLKLADRRLKEFAFIIENSKMAYFEKASSRYVTTIGLTSEKLDEENSLSETIIKKLESHPRYLERLQGKFPPQTAEWRFVQEALESAQVLLSKASEK